MTLREMIFGGNKQSEGWSPISQEQRQRQELFKLYWAYYRGRHRKALKVRPDQPDDNITLNYSKRVVNKGVQYLFGKSVTFETDGSTKERTPEEQYLDSAWGTDEEKAMLLQMIALNGGVTGMAIVRLYEPEPNVPDSLPRIVNIDPSIVEIVTNPDDITDVVGYLLTWKVGDVWKRHRMDVQQNGLWLVSEQILARNNQFDTIKEAPWPYPFANIVTAQNLPIPNEVWGMSDLEEADINDAINFQSSNTGRILKHHAHPKTIGTGFAANQLQPAAVDEFWTIPNADAKVANLEMQSDLAASRDFVGDLRTAYSKITGVPDLDPAVVNVGALSGFALRILYGDMLDLTQVKQNTYGALLNEINKRLLHIARKGDYGTITVKNVWQDPLPSSGLEEAQTLEIDRRNGLSMETYLTKRGYDPEQEKERSEAENKAADERMAQQQKNGALAEAMADLERE